MLLKCAQSVYQRTAAGSVEDDRYNKSLRGICNEFLQCVFVLANIITHGKNRRMVTCIGPHKSHYFALCTSKMFQQLSCSFARRCRFIQAEFSKTMSIHSDRMFYTTAWEICTGVKTNTLIRFTCFLYISHAASP